MKRGEEDVLMVCVGREAVEGASLDVLGVKWCGSRVQVWGVSVLGYDLTGIR